MQEKEKDTEAQYKSELEELRGIIKEVVSEEIKDLPDIVLNLKPKQRAKLLLMLMPYVFSISNEQGKE